MKSKNDFFLFIRLSTGAASFPNLWTYAFEISMQKNSLLSNGWKSNPLGNDRLVFRIYREILEVNILYSFLRNLEGVYFQKGQFFGQWALMDSPSVAWP
jgi:hypothetical protein